MWLMLLKNRTCVVRSRSNVTRYTLHSTVAWYMLERESWFWTWTTCLSLFRDHFLFHEKYHLSSSLRATKGENRSGQTLIGLSLTYEIFCKPESGRWPFIDLFFWPGLARSLFSGLLHIKTIKYSIFSTSK